MGTEKAARVRTEGRPLDDRQAGPAAPRMVLGARLRRLREARGVTREQAGLAIGSSGSNLCRVEQGRTRVGPRDVADLLTLYGVVDETERATVLALAEQADTPGWWHAYDDVVPEWTQAYLGLEQAASVVRCFEVQFVPGLLQTADYARAVLRLAHPRAPEAAIERRVELGLRRAEILRRPEPPHLWAVVDEAVLRRAIGGAAVMRAQLQHLISMTELPHVTVQILPFEAGGHAAAGGPITVLRLPGDGLPDVVYLEQLTSAVYLDEPADLQRYRHVMNRLGTEAESPAATRTLLAWILNDL